MLTRAGIKVASLVAFAAFFGTVSSLSASLYYYAEAYAQAICPGYTTGKQDNLNENSGSASADVEVGTGSHGWANANEGNLRAYTTATLSPDMQFSYSKASAWVRVVDTLTVMGAQSGDPVQLQFSYRVHGGVSSSRSTARRLDAWGEGTLNVKYNYNIYNQSYYAAYYDRVDYDMLAPVPAKDTLTTIIDTRVGDQIEITAYLNSQVFSNTDNNTNGEWVTAIANFGNTASLMIEPLTEGASFTSASGVTYAVPEPAIGGVLGVLALVLRRQPRVA